MNFTAALKQSLKDLLTSKKVLVTLAGLIVSLAAKHNIVLAPEDVTSILVVFGTLVGSLGIADFGKGAAIVAAANPPPAPPAPIAAGGDVIVEAPKQ